MLDSLVTLSRSSSITPHNTTTDVVMVDPSDDIGGTWDRFQPGERVLKLRCSAKWISLKILFLCCLIAVVLYRKTLLSAAVSLVSLGATVDGYSTLFCHIDSDKELQCLVHMQTQMPESRSCNITHDGDKYNFCGAFTH